MKDRDGWPIHVGARISVRPRPNTMLPPVMAWVAPLPVPLPLPRARLPRISGVVAALRENALDVVEFETFARRTVRPGDCRVQSGKTRKSVMHKITEQALAKPRRSSRSVRRKA